jgi:excinuclease ABC subunit C
MVQRIRDEAHRFGVTYHRQLRGKSAVRSSLDDIDGIGPKRRRALLARFGSIGAIRQASVEELTAVPGMTKRAAQVLKDTL